MFGAVLRAHRLAAGLTQDELAERASLSGRGVQDLERGLRRRPRPDTIRRLADVLELDGVARAELMSAGQPVAVSAEEPGLGAARPTLPVPLTSFVGRAREQAELGHLLATARLLTLVGMGGVGKTRLAIQLAASAARRYADGVYLIDLAALTQPELAVQGIAQVLGLRVELDRQPEAAVIGHLARRHALLLLDNCEHLIEGCAQLALTLLHSCPSVHVLATSREPLGIDGETLWRMSPLDDTDAVDLFIERAHAQRADFDPGDTATIAYLCRALDGLPLAIELAAARVEVLAPVELLARSDDRFTLLKRIGSRGRIARQQTLRATVDWSYALLEPAERQLFSRLAVFAGAFDLAGASAMDGPETLDVLERLVDKSLLVAQQTERGTRYQLLETLRSYAWERLDESGELERARHRHLEHFVRRAESLYTITETPDGPTRELDQHLDDLRRALEWAARANPGAGLRLFAALRNVWWRRGCAEGRRWGQVFLGMCQEPTITQAHALLAAGWLGVAGGDVPAGRPLLARAHALASQLGDVRGVAAADHRLGIAAFLEGSTTEALQHFEQALARLEELAEVNASAMVHGMMGWALLTDRARREEGRRHLERAHRLGRRMHDRAATGLAAFGLGLYARWTGQPARAMTHFLLAIADLDAVTEVPTLLTGLLQVARLLASSNPVRAARLAGGAYATADRAGVGFGPRSHGRHQLEADLTARLGEAPFRRAWKEGEQRTLDELVRSALAISERGKKRE